jgi:hypothetical protein
VLGNLEHPRDRIGRNDVEVPRITVLAGPPPTVVVIFDKPTCG